MLIGAKELFGYSILAQDGEIGSVHDVLFDDRSRAIRYIVVSTGVWLFGRKVLVAPAAVRPPHREEKQLPIDLTKEQIKDSPDISVDLPLSRDQEVEYHDYYRWPYYWGGGQMGAADFIGVAPEASLVGDTAVTQVTPDTTGSIPSDKRDPALVSAKDFIGYRVERGDEKIGEVVDLGINLDEPSAPLIVLALRGEEADRHVLVPRESVEVHWARKAVSLDLSPQELNEAPSLGKDELLDDSALDLVKHASI